MASLVLQGFNGLSLASILLLISFGLAFSFGLMNVINMAHGEFIMLGAYVTYMFQQSFAAALGGTSLGLWFVLAIVTAFVVVGALGVLMEVTLIRHLYGRPLDTLLATWGVGLMLQQAARSSSARRTCRWSVRRGSTADSLSPWACCCPTSGCSSSRWS